MPPNDLAEKGGVLLDIYTDLEKVKAAVRHLVGTTTTPEQALLLLRQQLNLVQEVYAVDEDLHNTNIWMVLIITGGESPPLVIKCDRDRQPQLSGGTP